MNDIVYIGNYESDLYFYNNTRRKSITYYGSNENGNTALSYNFKQRINIKNYKSEKINFIHEQIKQHIKINSNSKFVFYNQETAFNLIERDKSIANYFSCVNEAGIVRALNDKVYTKKWINNYISSPPTSLFHKSECTKIQLQKHFKHCDNLIFQDSISSGGYGTYKINYNEFDSLIDKLNNDSLYLVSPYIYDSISINVNVVIYKDEVVILQPSVQMINEHNQSLLYLGANYEAYTKFHKDIKNKIFDISSTLGTLLSGTGYRGVCGFDFLLDNEDNLYFIEINPRFQGSSFLLSAKLYEKYDIDLIDLNIDSFSNRICSYPIQDLSIKSKFYKINSWTVNPTVSTFKDELENSKYILLDGYNPSENYEYGAYLYKKIIV